MTEFVVALETVRHSDVASVGAKASVLGALLDAGYPVPPGICLTTDAFRLALKARWSEINVIIRDGDLRDPEGAVSAANRSLSSLLTYGCQLLCLRRCTRRCHLSRLRAVGWPFARRRRPRMVLTPAFLTGLP